MLYKSDIQEVHVKYVIWDFDCPPEELTAYLGVTPTEIRIKGETRLTGKKKHPLVNKNNGWIIKSQLPQSVEPDKHLESILEQIRPHKEKFIAMAKKYNAEVSFGIFFNHANPGITLTPEVLQELAELHAEVGFDMYYLQ